MGNSGISSSLSADRKLDKTKISGFGVWKEEKYSGSDSTGSPDLEYQRIPEYSRFGKEIIPDLEYRKNPKTCKNGRISMRPDRVRLWEFSRKEMGEWEGSERNR